MLGMEGKEVKEEEEDTSRIPWPLPVSLRNTCNGMNGWLVG